MSWFGRCGSVKPGHRTRVSFLSLQLTRCVLFAVCLCDDALNMGKSVPFKAVPEGYRQSQLRAGSL